MHYSNSQKRIWAVIGLFTVCFILWTACYRLITGYYPIPCIFRQFYYIDSEAKVKVFLLDKNFQLNKKGSIATAKIEGGEPVFYCLGTVIEGLLPMDYSYKGQLLLEIVKDHKVIYSFVAKDVETVCYSFRKDGTAQGINGYEFHTLPLQIAHKKYQGATIRVTVIEEDLEMYGYTDSVSISLYPQLRL